MNFCGCGCGKTTKNRFAPGHDAKLKSRLLTMARSGSEADRATAIAFLEHLGWAHFLTGRRVETSTLAISHRRFGVELEIQHSCRYAMVQHLRAAGIRVFDAGYTHQTSSDWKIVSDSSVRGGYEVVSPILQGQAGLDELQTVCRVLAENGARVNKTCGMHVHHDIAELTTDAVRRIVTTYEAAQASIDAVLAASRRTSSFNHFCRPFEFAELESIANAPTIEAMAARVSRYRTLNLTSYPKYGTLEFRQHQGTICFDKIRSWIIFGQQMIECGKAGRPASTLAEVLGATDVAQYYRARAASLAA